MRDVRSANHTAVDHKGERAAHHKADDQRLCPAENVLQSDHPGKFPLVIPTDRSMANSLLRSSMLSGNRIENIGHTDQSNDQNKTVTKDRNGGKESLFILISLFLICNMIHRNTIFIRRTSCSASASSQL